ncbi:MAG TPA: hypothetical protein PKL68_07090 [Actinomycetota bacterium]|nr:hypothetical protein [Actinomycetota bacterium]HNL51699.1 hypothetical protein [Actinomycetota bacterium]
MTWHPGRRALHPGSAIVAHDGVVQEITIALLPPLPGEQWSWREVAAELAAYNYHVRILPALPDDATPADGLDLAGAWVAHCALELATEVGRPPALLVAHGQAGRMLTALGFAQKASRRRVVGYVLVDGELPKPGVQDWPDAPVTYIGARQAHAAELRGWDVLNSGDLAADLRAVADQSA